MEKEILRGKFERKKVRHGVHHTKVEERSSKKQLRNEEAERMSQWELEDYLYEDECEGWDG